MYSSTALEGPSKSGCWKQLDYAEQNADSLFPLEYRSYLGQAAHAVLQYCAEQRADTEQQIRAVAEQVGNSLIKEGREFRGRMEPPLPPDDVWAGVDVAIQYLMANPLPLDADAIFPERDWKHPALPYRALIDLVAVYEEGDEECGRRVCEVTDYKSSWQADEDELNTLQRWGQAVCVWRWFQQPRQPDDPSGPDIIRQRIVNLRTWKDYTRDIVLEEPTDVAELEKWERRIDDLCKTADSVKSPPLRGSQGQELMSGTRPANPGVGCLSCAYRHMCGDAWRHYQSSRLVNQYHDIQGGFDLEVAAQDLAYIESQRSAIIGAIKAADPEARIPIQGGWVGWTSKNSRVFRPGAEKHVLSDWFEAMAAELPANLAPVLTSLLAAFKLGKSNADAFAKALYPQRKKGISEIREEYVSGITDEVKSRLFGVWNDD